MSHFHNLPKNIRIKYKGIVFETYLHFVIAYNFSFLLTYDMYDHSKAVSNKVKQNHMHTSVTNYTVLKLKSIKTLLVYFNIWYFLTKTASNFSFLHI